MTNEEKFIEIFGEQPDLGACPIEVWECMKKGQLCEDCSWKPDGFWKDEYKEPVKE